MPFNVLVTAPTLGAPGVARLTQAGCRVLYVKDGVGELERIMADEKIDAVISRTLRLDGKAIESCRSLRVIAKHGAGVNNIDVEAATRASIPVFYTPGANAQSVAELTFGLILAVARKISYHDRSLHDGKWTRENGGLQLQGRTLGVVGVGEIGSRVAKLGTAFGMRVVGFDPVTPKVETAGSLHELITQSDVISLHVPLNSNTRHMIGRREFELMRPSSILINTSRGGVVDEAVMAEFLEQKRIAGVGFDVFEDEPPKSDNKLLLLQNIVMTPHIGGSTVEALGSVSIAAADAALDYLTKGTFDPNLCVNPSVLKS